MPKSFYALKYIVILLIGSSISLYSSNLAVLFVYILFFVFGHLLIGLIFSKENIRDSFNIFFTFFLIYLAYSFITNEVFVSDPYRDYFVARDSLQFFGEIDKMLKGNNSLLGCYKIINTEFHYTDYSAFSLICVTIGYFANLIGHNSILVQKVQIVFLAAFIICFIYNIGVRLWDKKDAKKAAILYGLFSWIFFYSAVLLRDLDVAFVYAFAVYIFFRKISIKNFLLLCILSLIAGKFRPENGLFFLAFIGMYLFLYYLQSKKSLEQSIAIIFSVVALLAALFALGIIGSAIETLTRTTSNYQDLSLSDANKDGIGILLLKLPFGVRNVARAIYSQIAPFPFYLAYGMFEESIWTTPAAAAALFWFGLWSGIIFGFRNRVLRANIDKRILLLFIIGVLLILVASAGASDVRRIMCIYPTIYITGFYFFRRMKRTVWRRLLLNSAILYAGLIILYLFLKIN